MKAREFLEECKRNPPEKASERERKRLEAEAEAKPDVLSELAEKSAGRSPRTGRGCSNF